MDGTRLAMGHLVRCSTTSTLFRPPNLLIGPIDGSAHAMPRQVSTSNQLAADEVIVTTDAPLVWTTEAGE